MVLRVARGQSHALLVPVCTSVSHAVADLTLCGVHSPGDLPHAVHPDSECPLSPVNPLTSRHKKQKHTVVGMCSDVLIPIKECLCCLM